MIDWASVRADIAHYYPSVDIMRLSFMELVILRERVENYVGIA